MKPTVDKRPRIAEPGGRYTVAWLGGVVIGIANGTVRELTYRKRVGELTAHQISTATAISLFAAYFWGLEGRWPIPSRRGAVGIGATWVVLTMAFEFGFGHYVAKKSWSDLLRDYDLSQGRAWSVVLAWLALGPLAVRELRRRSAGSALGDGSERAAASTRP